MIIPEQQAYTGTGLGRLGCMAIILRAHEEQDPGLMRSQGSEEVPKRLCQGSCLHDSLSCRFIHSERIESRYPLSND